MPDPQHSNEGSGSLPTKHAPKWGALLHFFNPINVKIWHGELFFDILHLNTIFQVERITNIATHRKMVQVWGLGYIQGMEYIMKGQLADS